MAKKDKFKQLEQGGGSLSSFQEMVEQTSTVAAIVKKEEERREERKPVQTEQGTVEPSVQSVAGVSMQLHEYPSDVPRMTHLPNPWISAREYNLASQYCYQHTNMTRQDFVELAIIEKLHNEGLIPDEEFAKRRDEIRNRPPRGMRKNTKKQMNK